MGPALPSITLTTPTGATHTLLDNAIPHAGWAGVNGTRGRAMTNRGNAVSIWTPDPANTIDRRYFCHGHTLDTYRLYGYSVFSGASVLTALVDDYNELGAALAPPNALNLAIPGDIVSFSDGAGVVLHTSLVVNVPMNGMLPSGQNTRDTVTVWTKNGQHPECVQLLSATCAAYSNAPVLRFWRV